MSYRKTKKLSRYSGILQKAGKNQKTEKLKNKIAQTGKRKSQIANRQAPTAKRKPQTVNRKPIIIFLVGPTAIGKSELALRLAKKINAEIISLDSMQLYKGLDILSAKPSLAKRRQVAHHLLDVVSPEERFDVTAYRRLALKKIREIHKKAKTPLFVGGAGLYMSVVIDGIFREVKKDEGLRRRLYALAERKGNAFIYNKLKAVDQAAAAKLHPNDLRRSVRALEVYQHSGKPISELWRQTKGLGTKYDIKIFGLNKERQELYKDINTRVEKMFAQGLVQEVKRLLKQRLSLTALKAIGINEIRGYLEGRYPLEYAKDLLKKNTRHYAKRQLTWFRKDKRVRWIDMDRGNAFREIMKKICPEKLK